MKGQLKMRKFEEVYAKVNNVKKKDYSCVGYTTVDNLLDAVDKSIEHRLSTDKLAYEYSDSFLVRLDKKVNEQEFLKEITSEIEKAKYIVKKCTLKKIEDTDKVYSMQIELKLNTFSNAKIAVLNFLDIFNIFYLALMMLLSAVSGFWFTTKNELSTAIICLVTWIPLSIIIGITLPVLKEHLIKKSIAELK